MKPQTRTHNGRLPANLARINSGRNEFHISSGVRCSPAHSLSPSHAMINEPEPAHWWCHWLAVIINFMQLIHRLTYTSCHDVTSDQLATVLICHCTLPSRTGFALGANTLPPLADWRPTPAPSRDARRAARVPFLCGVRSRHLAVAHTPQRRKGLTGKFVACSLET